jgi:hypothetical protein
VSILISNSAVGTHADPGVQKICEQTTWPHEAGGIGIPPAGCPVTSLTRSTPLNRYPFYEVLAARQLVPVAAVRC